jgi:hypothetical protein
MNKLLHRLLKSFSKCLEAMCTVRQDRKIVGHIAFRERQVFIPADNADDDSVDELESRDIA